MFTLFRTSGIGIIKILGCFSTHRQEIQLRTFATATRGRSSHISSSNNATTANRRQQRQPTFGLIAAVTRNGIIGINNKLPWKHNNLIPQDWDHFIHLTRNKILIMGRKTFGEEDPTRAHVNHARVCIVVSNTMKESDLLLQHDGNDIDVSSSVGPELIVKLARSFDEALDLASDEEALLQSGIVKDVPDENQTDDDHRTTIIDNTNSQTIDCWVAGGENIYREALLHENAKEVQLTHVDMEVNLDQCESSSARSSIAYFPLEEMKRQGFKRVSSVSSGLCDFCVYKRVHRDT